MEWKIWSSLPLTQREFLPNQPGIYTVVDAEEQVWYVGQSANLNARWRGRGHHRYQQLHRTNKKRLYKIYWKLFPHDQLDEKEKFYISLFKPHLNYSRVKSYVRKSVQPINEISRLLKVLNKKTFLFPSVRSVVLGYYKEVDEDEEGKLEEFTCIVLGVNINDYDGPILKSYQKSYSKKGINLKGCWFTYERQCENNDLDAKPATILVFLLNYLAYEFVCCPGLIDNLEKLESSLYNIEIAKQAVLALKDPSILSALIVKERFAPGSEDYLRYRVGDLRPISQLLAEISED